MTEQAEGRLSRAIRAGRKPLKGRLLARVEITTSGCWEFQGSRSEKGYGRIGSGSLANQTILAHRASWLVHKGDIPLGMFVLHHCDNPPCINPAHLFLGDHKTNMEDMSSKGRGSGNPNGGGKGTVNGMCKLTDDQVSEIRSLYAETSITQKVIAERFGVSKSLISAIISGNRRVA